MRAIELGETRTRQLIEHDGFGRGTLGKAYLNAVVCTRCSHSAAWHPRRTRGGFDDRKPCLYPGCGCGFLDLRPESK